MRDEIAEAIAEACETPLDSGRVPATATDRRVRRQFLRRLGLLVAELPDDLTIAELREELEA